MPNELDPKFLANLFKKIRLGFSEIEVEGSPCFVKHSTSLEVEKLNSYYEHFFNKSKKMGVMGEKELKELLQEEEIWTKKDDDDLYKKESELENLNKTLKGLFLQKERDSIKLRISEIECEVKELKNKNISLLKNTAEKYAEKKSNESFVFDCLFKTEDLDEHFYTEEEFNEIGSSELTALYSQYNDALSDFSEKNLKQLSISGLFYSLFNLYSDDLTNFFDKHPINLSFYQINVLNYGKMFKSIFENHAVPDNIRNDAEAILNHLDDVKNKKKRAEEISHKAKTSDGFSFAKAKEKDLENMGVDKRGTKDIHEIAKDSGGDLSMEDFMKMHKK